MPVRAAGPAALAVVLGAFAAIPATLHGHHSVLAYENERGVRIEGIVERVAFANPHTILVVSRERPDGASERWIVESESAAVLARLGWDDGMIEIGDRVTAVGARAKDGSARIRCQRLELENERELPCFPLK